MALIPVTQEAIYIQNLLHDMGYKHKDACPLVVYEDNQGAIALSKNVQFHKRTHYIEKQYYFVREHVYKGDIKIK